MSDFVRKVGENWSQIGAGASIKRQSAGATNHVFRIQSSETYYLRKYSVRNVAKIKLEHELLRKLFAKFEYYNCPCFDARSPLLL